MILLRSVRSHLPLFLIFIFPALPGALLAQQGYRWTVYSAMNSGQGVAFDADGKLWIATTGGVAGYDLAADSYTIYHTRDQIYPEKQGLLSLNSTAVGVDPATGDLYVGSDDGLVSIRRKSGRWSYSAEIAAMTDRPSRYINGFGFADGHAYILTAFGVGVYSPADSSFIESYFRFGSIPSNTAVRSIAFWRGRIWVGTEKGLASAPQGASNLPAPDSWTVHPLLEGRSVLSFAQIGDSMVVGTDSGAYSIDAGGEGMLRGDLPLKPVFVASTDGKMLACDEVSVYQYDGSAFGSASGLAGSIKALALRADGTSAFALRDSGFAYRRDGISVIRRPNTPVSNNFEDLTSTPDGSVWCASNGGGFSRLKEESWSEFNTLTLPALRNEQVWNIGRGRNAEIWAATVGGGVVEVAASDGAVTGTRYDSENSSLTGVSTNNAYVVVGKPVTDVNGRTWIINWSDSPIGPALLAHLRPDEQSRDGSGFESFVAPFSVARQFRALAIDDNGTKWLGADVRVTSAAGLLYMNDHGTPTNFTDDTWGVLNTGDNLLDNRQGALVVDKLGELWIGTPRGVQVLVNPVSVVNSDARPVFRAIRAMADISINAIEVDALNRKWIGTDQGLYLLSAEGDAVLAKYTASNSPLVNDQIRSILAVHATGDIYIGTTNGLSRVSTEAVEPREGAGTISVSPHPFILPASEPLRITGLPADAEVKIFGAGMTLVRQFAAPGGAVALWDGRDNAGVAVPSGVYVIAAGPVSGDVAVVGKVAVIRR